MVGGGDIRRWQQDRGRGAADRLQHLLLCCGVSTSSGRADANMPDASTIPPSEMKRLFLDYTRTSPHYLSHLLSFYSVVLTVEGDSLPICYNARCTAAPSLRAHTPLRATGGPNHRTWATLRWTVAVPVLVFSRAVLPSLPTAPFATALLGHHHCT